jgi:hypothetical protein
MLSLFRIGSRAKVRSEALSITAYSPQLDYYILPV